MIFFTRRVWPPQTHRYAMALPPLLSALREGLLHDHYDHCDHHNQHHNHKRTITINNVIYQHWGDQDKEDMHVRSAYSRDKMYLDWSCLEKKHYFLSHFQLSSFKWWTDWAPDEWANVVDLSLFSDSYLRNVWWDKVYIYFWPMTKPRFQNFVNITVKLARHIWALPK